MTTAVAAIIPLLWICLQLPHLFLDPWNDELYTLRHFVVVPVMTTVLDYHVPNNHVFFSFLMNLWRRVGGIADVSAAMDRIVFLRTLPLLFSTVTIFIVYRTALRLGGLLSGVLAAVMVMSSVPFYNYACQLRGYGLSMMLTALLVGELTKPTHRQLLLIVLSAGILYTLPSNLYLLLSVGGYAALSPLVDSHSRIRTPLAILCGIGLATLAYLPVIPQFRSFDAGRRSGFDMSTLTVTAPRVAFHFLSGRWLLLLLPLAYFAVRLRHRSWALPERLIFFSAITFLIPFVMSAVRGDGAPDRIYLSVLPILCLSWGIVSGRAIAGLRGIMKPGALWLSILLCGFALLRGVWTGESKAAEDRQNGTRCADLYFQYYLHDFQPRKQARAFSLGYDRLLPVVDACGMDSELPKYLQQAGVAVLPRDTLERLAESRRPFYAVVDGARHDVHGSDSALSAAIQRTNARVPGIVYVPAR